MNVGYCYRPGEGVWLSDNKEQPQKLHIPEPHLPAVTRLLQQVEYGICVCMTAAAPSASQTYGVSAIEYEPLALTAQMLLSNCQQHIVLDRMQLPSVTSWLQQCYRQYQQRYAPTTIVPLQETFGKQKDRTMAASSFHALHVVEV